MEGHAPGPRSENRENRVYATWPMSCAAVQLRVYVVSSVVVPLSLLRGGGTSGRPCFEGHLDEETLEVGGPLGQGRR